MIDFKQINKPTKEKLMKNTVKFLGLFFLSIIIVFTACKKEDDANNNNNNPIDVIKYYVEVDGNKTKMDTMYDAYYKDYWNNYYHEYLLVEKDAGYDDFMQSILGNATGFSFQVETNNNSLLPDGDYFLDSTNTTPAQGDIRSATFYIDYDFFMGSGDNIKMKSGSCNIKSTGTSNKYKVEGTFLGVDSKVYKIYFDGVVSKVFVDNGL